METYFCNVAQRECPAGAQFLVNLARQGQNEMPLDETCKAVREHNGYSDDMRARIADGFCPAYASSEESVIVEGNV